MPTREPIGKTLRFAVLKRDRFTCRYCGVRAVRLECDHILPLSRGGTNDEHNLTTACFSCNRSKGNKTLAEWKGVTNAVVPLLFRRAR